MEIATRYQAQDRSQAYHAMDIHNQGEESGAEAKGRARRKFQRASDDKDDLSFRKPTLSASAMRAAADNNVASIMNRRTTNRENRPLLGPRPLEHASPSKRIVSESAAAASHHAQRSFLPSSASMPVLDPTQSQKSRNTRYSSHGAVLPSPKASDASASFQFLPAISFDDFQTDIAINDLQKSPRLTEFPRPVINTPLNGGTQQSMPRSSSLANGLGNGTTQSNHGHDKVQTIPRRPVAAPRESPRIPQDIGSAIPSTAPLSLGHRRQSNLPATAPPAPSTRTPRKSVAPGLLTNMMEARRNDPSQAMPVPFPPPSSLSRTPSLSKGNPRLAMAPGSVNVAVQSRQPVATRIIKPKVLQPPPRHSSMVQLPVASSLEQSPAATRNTPKVQSLRPSTPTSSGKRQQSGRVSGLGARTTSPTDARRLRRLSMLPNAPPGPHSSPSPQPNVPFDVRTIGQSPSLIPRKPSLTPASARETPESGLRFGYPSSSLSRSSSYHSVREPSASGFPRISQSPSLSKLPTPKPHNVYSPAEKREELVPPVPAIPKAYESPKEEIESPFFSDYTPTSETRATPADSIGGSAATALPTASPSGHISAARDSLDQQRQRRGRTVTTGRVPEKLAPPSAVNKKSLQPMRLPPLNLLPLSTPTSAKIASFPAPSAEVERRRDNMTPTRRATTKTPSTPMTASKATFNRRYDDEQLPPMSMRSSSSHHALRGGRIGPEEMAVGVTIPQGQRQALTPFTSGSLPKSGLDYSCIKRQPTDEYTLGHHDIEVHTSRPMGPRPRTVSKSTRDPVILPPAVPSHEEQEASTPGSSLRRKLSMGWRKSSPKTANARDNAEEAHVAKEMPPPRLPASATWSGPVDGHTAKPQAIAHPSLEASRLAVSKAALANGGGGGNGTQIAKMASSSDLAVRPLHSNPAQPPPMPRSTSWSVLGMNRSPAPRLASSSLASSKRPPTLDKDDVAANEEMKRLSTKRRDVESAALLTDELRKQATPKERKTPAQATQTSASLLNIYEKGEIIDYKDGVYFCGTKNAKKHVGDISEAGTTNFGYDDERGDYNIVVGDHLAYRYEVVDLLGKGSFGQVVRCIDHKLGGLCAVKIIRNKKRFHQQALVEVNILNKLKEWDPDEAHATLAISSSFYFRSHLCITTPCLSINLYELIRAHSFSGFSIPLIRRIARQLLACLCLLQSKRVIHCDLKPENILLCDPRRADIRVIDFGSSCKADEKVYTYIQSRFYRSPEVILGSEYGLGIDMWSLGCILAELYTGYPIFPGENEQEQLACIMEIFGPPTRDIIEKASRRKLFFDSNLKPRITVSSKGRRRRPSSKTLSMTLKCDDEAFLDFMTQCLRWDPERRLRPDQALSHPFVTNEPMRRMPDRPPRSRTAIAQSGPAVTGGIPSPIKRVQTTTGVVSTSASTPVRDTRNRPLPETPSTAVRNGVSIVRRGSTAAPASPVKGPAAKRQTAASGAAGATSAAGASGLALPSPSMALTGSKRATNGAALLQGVTGVASNTSLPRVGSGRVDLAGAAARKSMGAGT